MDFAHLFEAMMLVCFGFSWPLNVRKAYKARTAKGTSLAFICLIIFGYIAGISAKFINHQMNYVLVVYFLNLAIVSLNVFVYIRNRKLDKKRAKDEKRVLKFENVEEVPSAEEVEEKVTALQTAVAFEEQNAVLLMGGTFDKNIPVSNLAKAFDFDFEIYNKSSDGLSVENAAEYYETNLKKLNPEGILVHLGENDLNLFKNSTADFDNAYLKFLDEVKNVRPSTRIALLSVRNVNHDRTVAEMNAHIKAIADAERCAYINLDNSALWNPEATKAAGDFAYSMGVRTRKPLKNVAEILYSYAFTEAEKAEAAARSNESIAG